MDDLLPTPNEQRTASGAPGRGYWQQRADYDIKVELDDGKQRISASEPSLTTTTHPIRSLIFGSNSIRTSGRKTRKIFPRWRAKL